MKRLVLCILCVLVATASGRAGIDPDSAVHRFLGTLPYQVHYVRVPNLAPYWERGWSFSALKLDSCDAVSADSCYVLAQSPILYPHDVYLLLWTTVSDTLRAITVRDPAGNRYPLRGTSKPPAVSTDEIRRLDGILGRYASVVDEYREAEGRLSNLNFELYLEVGALAGLWAGVGFMVASENRDTRTGGYLVAGLLAVAMAIDVREYFRDYEPVRREAKRSRTVLEKWDEGTTRQVMDSLESAKSK